MSKLSPHLTSKPSFRLLIFLVVTFIIGGILLGLPPQFQRLLFGLMIGVALIIALSQVRNPIQNLMRSGYSIHQHHPLRVARVSFVIMLILLGLSTYFYQPQYSKSVFGFNFLILSLPFLRLSYPLFPTLTTSSTVTVTEPLPPEDIRWVWIVVSVISMIILTLMNVPKIWVKPIYALLASVGTTPHIQMLILCIGLLTLLYGFGVRLIPRRFSWERHHLILLGILLLAGLMRFWDLEETIHMFIDEFHFIRGIVAIEVNKAKILYPRANEFTDVFSYFQFMVKTLMGANLAVLRLPSALFGVLSVLGVYALARETFSLRIALLSAFLLAVMPAHVHFSRIGINNIAGATVGIWLFVYIVRGIRYQRLADFAVAGVLLGLTHYFYEGERLFFTPFVACLLVWIMVFCRRNLLIRLPNRKQLIVLGFCLLVVVVPLYHTFWSHKHPFSKRFNVTHNPDMMLSDYPATLLLDNPLNLVMKRYVQTDIYETSYQSDYAYILPILVPFFLFGFGVLLWRIFTLYGALFVWLAVGVAIGNGLILDTFSAASPRFVIIYGVLMIITAVGIDTLWSVFSGQVTARLKSLIQVGFLIYLGYIGIYQVDYYFNTTVPNYIQRIFTNNTYNGRGRPAHDDMMLRAVTLPPNTTVHIFSNLLFPYDLIKGVPIFYGRSEDDLIFEPILVRDLTEDYFETLPRDRNHVFTLTQYHESSIMTMVAPYFIITNIDGSPYDIPEDVEMKFYHASVSS